MKRLVIFVFVAISLSIGHLLHAQSIIDYRITFGHFQIIRDNVIMSSDSLLFLFPSDTLVLPDIVSGDRGFGIRTMVNNQRMGSDKRFTGYEGKHLFESLLNDTQGLLKKTTRTAAYKRVDSDQAYFKAIADQIESLDNGYSPALLDSVNTSLCNNTIFIDNFSTSTFFVDIICILNGYLLSAVSQNRDFVSDYLMWAGCHYEIELSETLCTMPLYLVCSIIPLKLNGVALHQPLSPDNAYYDTIISVLKVR